MHQACGLHGVAWFVGRRIVSSQLSVADYCLEYWNSFAIQSRASFRRSAYELALRPQTWIGPITEAVDRLSSCVRLQECTSMTAICRISSWRTTSSWPDVDNQYQVDIVDISNSNCWYQQRYLYWYQQLVTNIVIIWHFQIFRTGTGQQIAVILAWL